MPITSPDSATKAVKKIEVVPKNPENIARALKINSTVIGRVIEIICKKN